MAAAPSAILVVDEVNGPYKTIKEAVMHASPNAEIRIASGLYADNIEIKTPGLRLVPKDKEADIIWVAYVGPALTVNLPEDGKVYLNNFKFTHTATDTGVKDNDDDGKPQVLIQAFATETMDKSTADDKDPNQSNGKNLHIYDRMNTIIHVKRGKIEINDSILSLNFIQKQDEVPLPAIVLSPGSYGKFVGLDIKGNILNPTIGILCRNANLQVEECSINNHMCGGILIYNEKIETQVRISRSKFTNNKPANIEVLGYTTQNGMEEKVIVIEENTILGTDKDGIGVKVGVAAKPKLFLNLIKDLKIGVYVISSDPFIYRNSIVECQTGIMSTVFQNHVAEPRILINEIRGHEENGILVTGLNNNTVIKNNTAIRDNKKAGIRVECQAYARIMSNKISNNLNQGILIVENSHAYVHGNYIYQNIKANIAFGGSLSENTIIIRNKIFNSASEGIFMILAGRCIINMNEVYGNYDGIIAVESVPNLHFNSIFRNRNNGVIMLRGSKPDLRENNIYENEGVGLVLREKSFGPAIKNVIQDNEMDLVVEYETPNLEKELIEKNSIGPDQRLPQRTKCNLI